MKLAVLYSGGKDSNYALYKAAKHHKIACIVTLKSQNPESYMFQTPGNDWIDLQAECLEIPLIRVETQGVKEKELDDLKVALLKAISNYGIDGVVTGAIQSAYQASRVQRICSELNLACFNPLWQIDEEKFLNELLENKFEITIVGIASYPLEEEFLGKTINFEVKDELHKLKEKYSLSLIGEGGEFESFITDAPTFNKKILIESSIKKMDSTHSGVLEIIKARTTAK